MYKRLYLFLEPKNILAKEQKRFRNNMSINSAIFGLVKPVQKTAA